jgi:hypothetical protein
MSQEEKSFLNLAGEFAVASELNRRHVQASITYGTSKSADVFAVSKDARRILRIEVKTTDKKKWPLGQKVTTEAQPPDMFWVLVQLPPPLNEPGRDDAERGAHSPRYFVLSAQELHNVWREGVEKYYEAYRRKHGREFDESGGVPNVLVRDVSTFEGRWQKITSHLNDDGP